MTLGPGPPPKSTASSDSHIVDQPGLADLRRRQDAGGTFQCRDVIQRLRIAEDRNQDRVDVRRDTSSQLQGLADGVVISIGSAP